MKIICILVVCFFTLWIPANGAGNGWILANWFSPYYSYSEQIGWVHHEFHDWLYIFSDDEDGLYYYDERLGWCWTSEQCYPYIMVFGAGNWAYYENGSTNPRRIYDLYSRSWYLITKRTYYDFHELDVLPTVLKEITPVYPPELREIGIEGRVVLEMVIGTDGYIDYVGVLESPHELFSQSCIDAVTQWRFTPGYRNGTAVKTRARMTHVFTNN